MTEEEWEVACHEESIDCVIRESERLRRANARLAEENAKLREELEALRTAYARLNAKHHEKRN